MLIRHQTVTANAALHRSRITLASVSGPGPGSPSSSPPPHKMSAAQPRASSEQQQHQHGEIKQQRPQPPATYFPLGYKDAAYQWWTSVSPVTAERNVLSFMPHLREAADSLANPNPSNSTTAGTLPVGTPIWRRSLVPLSGANRALNELSIERAGEDPEETLVMVHGYGAGLCFFYKNFEPMSRIPGLKLYALDMLGMGNSSRPPFKIHARTREEQVVEAENWFIDALEEWRRERKIERFTLLGHSLGGYLAVSYALKYPGHLNKLILASPVGIPKDPYAVNASMPEPTESTLAQEFTEDQQTVTESNVVPSTTTTANNAPSAKNSSSAAPPPPPAAPKRPLPGWLVWLWDANISPFSIVRMSGPLGPRFVSGWSSRRFNHLPPAEAQALHDYSFSIFKQKGSGEYALAYILAPGAYARRPVIDRIQDVGRQVIAPARDDQPARKETGIPVVFMYGEHDWMDAAGGLAAEEKLKQAKIKALLHGTDEEKRGENGSAKVVMIPKAGHHLYLDNPDFFNNIMKEEMESTLSEVRKRKLVES